MEYSMRTDGTRVRVHRVDVDVVARFERDGSIVSVCVQRLDGRSFPVDEVLEAAPFSGPPLHGRRSACTVSGSGGTRPSCTSSSGPRGRRLCFVK